ncbi:MAG: peptide deformylase [Deinococcaceae bacterium]
MIYPLRFYGDPVLRMKAKPIADVHAQFTVPGFDPVHLGNLVQSMFDTMYEARGVGLAAPQVGLPIRLFVAAEYADDEDESEKDKPLRSKVLHEWVMVNPKIEFLTKRKDKSYQEGCLSIPGVYEEGVPRFQELRIHWQDLSGQSHSTEFGDYMARVMQHENDHLNGKLFLDYLPVEIVQDYRKELSLLQRRSRKYLEDLKGKTK